MIESVARDPRPDVTGLHDGVTEAENASEQEFGEERLREAIEAASKGSAKEILDWANGNLPAALVMSKTGASRDIAESALAEARGVVSEAVNLIRKAS